MLDGMDHLIPIYGGFIVKKSRIYGLDAPPFIFDKASLLSGKLHAIVQRSYTKGHDIYDLLWYLSDPTWPEPNLILLNNALAQTNWQGVTLTKENWKGQVWQRLKSCNWIELVDDVRPFVEPSFDLNLLKLENFEMIMCV